MVSIPRLPTLPGVKVFTPAPSRFPFVPSREEQRAALEAADAETADTYDLVLSLAAIVGAACHQFYHVPAQLAAQLGGLVKHSSGLVEARDNDLAKKINPLFKKHGVRMEADSPVTKSYMQARQWKSLAGDGFNLLGNLVGLSPVALHSSPTGIVYHGHATTLTAIHIDRLKKIAARHPDDQPLLDWIRFLRTAKEVKIASRGGMLVSGFIPFGAIAASIANALLKASVKMTCVGAAYATAAKLHWFAYQERPPGVGKAPVLPSLPAGLGRFTVDFPEFDQTGTPLPPRPGTPPSRSPSPRPAGPAPVQSGGATEVLRELFTKRGITHLLGSYDVDAIIAEPAGWLAVADKILLL